MSPLLKSVERAGLSGLRRKRDPGSISARDFFDGAVPLRTEFAKLINSKETNRIVIIPSVSYGLAAVTKNVTTGRGDNIVVAAEQFPSNYYPWKRLSLDNGVQLRTIAPPDTLAGRGATWNQRILEAIDRNTRIVALGNVHWADGTIFNLAEIRRRTRDVGGLLIIDGTQSVGALPFDLTVIQPDALICGGYKWLMGPYSFGLAYYGSHFDHGIPIEENWLNRQGSEDFQRLVQYQNEYQPGALRFEVGEHSNFIFVPMMLEALKQINKWKPANIQEYCRKITSPAISKLHENGFWIEEEKYRSCHLFGIRLPERIQLNVLKETLKKNKIHVSFRGNAIRVAPNVYNTREEIDKLASLLIR